MEMRPFGKLVPLEAAVDRLLRATVPIGSTERVTLDRAVGRVAARDHRARTNVPPFARASWDGYAFAARASRGTRPDRPRNLKIVGEVYAEGGYTRPVSADEAVAIATGGALPPGADTVLIFEEARVGGGWLTLQKYHPPGERVARVGDDYRKGTLLAGRGRPLTPAAIGALGASGMTRAIVYRRPRVTVIPNGNELVSPGQRLGPQQIYESNNLVLAGVVRALGAEVTTIPPVVDDPNRIEAAIRRSLPTSDLVVVTGGSSVGERDYLPGIFPRLGRLLFHGIAVRPGKPTLAVRAGRKLVLGMPGHPTSCLANGFWMLLPILRKMGHRNGDGTVPTQVTIAEGYPIAEGDLATVVPLRVDAGRAWPTFKQSHAITSLIAANAFVIVPPGGRSLRRGERRTVQLLPEPIVELPRAA